MTSILGSHSCTLLQGAEKHIFQGRNCGTPCSGYSEVVCTPKELNFLKGRTVIRHRLQRKRGILPVFSATADGASSDDSEGSENDKSQESEIKPVNNDMIRERLERMVGSDDSSFSGTDLATLIRNKFGRSYDVQLIKKEFMGRNLLALNVMWKYMEQRSFPLTEEEYLLRLDDVANTLRCWGAVSHVRNSLQKLKERPRIGKAVSIFIDMDESGGRANEWIYK